MLEAPRLSDKEFDEINRIAQQRHRSLFAECLGQALRREFLPPGFCSRNESGKSEGVKGSVQ